MMKNKKKAFMSTTFAMLMVFMLTLVSMAPLALGDGSTATATDIGDLKSATGCTDATTPVKTGEDVSIKITGGAGTLLIDDFREVDITFYGYFDQNDDVLVVTITDEDDSDNYIEVTFDPNSDEMYVDVEDHTSSGSSSESAIVDLGSSNEALDAWLLIEIVISATDEYDGTGSQLNVDVENKDAIEDYKLQSYELKGTYKVRKFNEGEWAVASGKIVYVDLIDMDAQAISSLGSYTWTIIILLLSIVMLFVFMWVGWWPFGGGPLGSTGKKIVSPFKRG